MLITEIRHKSYLCNTILNPWRTKSKSTTFQCASKSLNKSSISISLLNKLTVYRNALPLPHRHSSLGFLDGSMVNNSLQCRKLGLDLWVRKILWRRAWQPTPVFLPGKSHGQGKLVGCSPYSRKRVRQDFATKQQHSSVPNSIHRQMASMCPGLYK